MAGNEGKGAEKLDFPRLGRFEPGLSGQCVPEPRLETHLTVFRRFDDPEKTSEHDELM